MDSPALGAGEWVQAPLYAEGGEASQAWFWHPERLTEKVTVRLSLSEWDLIGVLAAQRGVKTAGMVRQLLQQGMAVELAMQDVCMRSKRSGRAREK